MNAGRRARIATRMQTVTGTGVTDMGTVTGATGTILVIANVSVTRSVTENERGTGIRETADTGNANENGTATETVTDTVETRRTVTATPERREMARGVDPRLFQRTRRPTTVGCPTGPRPVATEATTLLASGDEAAMTRYVPSQRHRCKCSLI